MIAIFDLDHTLISANSSYCFGAFLYQKKKISLFQTIPVIITYGLHKIGLFSLERVHNVAIAWIFKGRSAEEIAELASLFWDIHLVNLLRPKLIEQLELHKTQKFTNVLSSSSPSFLVEPIAKKLGFDRSQSSQYLVDKEGKFVRILVLVNGNEKKNHLEAIVSSSGSKQVFTTAYTDSHLDLPLLLKVNKPVCVNPDSKLRRFAEQYSWEIIEDECSIRSSKRSL